MKRKEYPTKEILEKYFVADPDNGILYRKTKKGLKECCANNKKSHPDVGFQGDTYQLHVLLFIMYYGYRPEEVDHKDTNPRNNRKDNLRDASRSQNNANRNQQCNNTSGYKGVSWEGSSWRYQVRHEGKNYSKRGFKTAEEAFEASKILRESLHKEFTNFG
ncbi:hypothetical protein falkor_99 [Salmonella phage falkor]|nr:hypothetical protein HWD24_gp099 [Salmonella phage rokbiter]QIN99876.1 hypothetical protein misterkot_96 [Salmonella phage misterkot]QIO00531.1 hypothetical protein rokbiter_99 [Salmonella phage rokbiter]QIO01914.1 hypothetical protein falkor_99 [Salmonella phage falkor]WFG41281.1 putative H-N-H-endonuclease P-TflX [Salmonella phage MET_P1_137_112]